MFFESDVPHVANHTDHLAVHVNIDYGLADRIPPGPERARESLIDDDDTLAG